MHFANPVWRRLFLALAVSALLHAGLARLFVAPSFLPYLASAEGVHVFYARLEPRAVEPAAGRNRNAPTEAGQLQDPLHIPADVARLVPARAPARESPAADADGKTREEAAGWNQLTPLHELYLDYPVSYRGMSISAHVVLDMQLAPDGRVRDLRVVDVFPPEYSEFGQAALEAFDGARFAVQAGAQQSTYRIRVDFTPEPLAVPE